MYSNPRFTIQYYRNYAAGRGGECLSNKYIRQDVPLDFICAKKHKFSIAPDKIHGRQQWCRYCNGYRRHTTESLRALINSKGGRLLSAFRGLSEPVRIKCRNNHIWSPRATNVIHAGAWCPECGKHKLEHFAREIFQTLTGKKFPSGYYTWLTYRGRQLQLDGYCKELEIAFEYQGAQHYRYIQYFSRSRSGYEQMRLRDRKKKVICKRRGITLITIPNVQKDKLEDYILKQLRKNNIPINDRKIGKVDLSKWHSPDKLAYWGGVLEKRGDILLSKRHVYFKDKFRVRCGRCGKVYRATQQSLLANSGCPNCNPYKHNTIKDLRQIARDRKLKYLSRMVAPCDKEARWKCLRCGEEFYKRPTIIRQGWGCRCGQKCPKLTLRDLIMDAKSIGLTLLEKSYLGHKSRHRYKCPRHGVVLLFPGSVRKSHGCRKCRYIRQLMVGVNKYEVRSQDWSPRARKKISAAIAADKRYLLIDGRRRKLNYRKVI